MCRLAGSGRKHDLFIRIHPLSLKDTSEYLGCHYSMHTRWFTKTWKSWFWVHFLALFPWKKHFLFKVAGSGRKVIIWPEMDIWGTVGLFCTEIRYLNMFWKDLGKIEKNRFLKFWFVGHHTMNIEISIFRPNIGHMILEAPLNTLDLFSNQNVAGTEPSFDFYNELCDFWKKVKNCDF